MLPALPTQDDSRNGQRCICGARLWADNHDCTCPPIEIPSIEETRIHSTTTQLVLSNQHLVWSVPSDESHLNEEDLDFFAQIRTVMESKEDPDPSELHLLFVRRLQMVISWTRLLKHYGISPSPSWHNESLSVAALMLCERFDILPRGGLLLYVDPKQPGATFSRFLCGLNGIVTSDKFRSGDIQAFDAAVALSVIQYDPSDTPESVLAIWHTLQGADSDKNNA